MIGNPPEFPDGHEPLLRLGRIVIQLDVWGYLRRREIVLPVVEFDRPAVHVASVGGRNNLGAGANLLSDASRLKIGTIHIQDGRARVSSTELGADFELTVSTRQDTGSEQNTITAQASGTYAEQPMAATLTAAGLAGLDGASKSWPFELSLTNGPTRVAVKGALERPLSLSAAAVDLSLTGPDMALLTPLISTSLPVTPPYELNGKLNYSEGRFHFTDITGRIGQSHLAGTFTVARGPERPELTAELTSRSVDLRDIVDLLRGEPGPPDTPGQTPQQRERAAKVSREDLRNPRLLPDRPFNLPKLKAIDVHLSYRADHIKGPSMPLDNLSLRLDAVGGTINLRPLSFGIGQGRMTGEILLTPGAEENVQARAEIRFERLDLARLMQASGSYRGNGTLNGTARIEGSGRSIADILGQAEGALTVSTTNGSLSKLLVDLAGLRLGSALLTSLGGKAETQVECFLADLTLHRGVLSTRTLLLETEEAVMEGRGAVNLRRERIELRIRTESKHLTLGVVPSPLLISGTLKAASAGPERSGGSGGGLGDVLAALPTIQLGVGDDPRCERLVRRRRR
ncbi:AsmA family protein [Roseomonas sp. GCM10028921]